MYLRTAFAFVLLTSPVLADEAFTRADVDAAYAIGLADGNARAVNSTPAAQALAAKLKPQAPAKPAPAKPAPVPPKTP